MLYLDHAATSPVLPEVIEAMRPYQREVFGNPSSHHSVGEAASSALEAARAQIADALGMRTGDVIFTSGGTEANNLAVKGTVLGGGLRHVITSTIEHESILESARFLHRFHRVQVTVLPVDRQGVIDADAVDAALAEHPPGTSLVTFGQASNEVGTVQDADALIGVARRHRAVTHVDAVQSAGWLDLRPLGRETRVDAISVAGHKLGAPKGIGALGVRARVPLEPLLHGGGQERGRRSGTENVAGAVGLATALRLAETDRERHAGEIAAATRDFIRTVRASVPRAAFTGSESSRLPHVASFTFAGTSGEAVLLELERRGVVSSSGSACAAGSDEPSPVLLALGIAPEVAQTAVRFTFGRTALPGGSAARLAALVADAVDAVVR